MSVYVYGLHRATDPDSTIPLLGGRVARLDAGTGFGKLQLTLMSDACTSFLTSGPCWNQASMRCYRPHTSFAGHRLSWTRARCFLSCTRTVTSTDIVSLLLISDFISSLNTCCSAVLRRHHLRQQKMAEGLHLLQNVAVFRDAGYAKLAQIAFAMKFVQVSAKTRLVCAGDGVETVYLLGTGLVSVLSRCADPARDGAQAGGVFKSMSLAVAQWGKGFVVGERELQGGLQHFENTYETVGPCEMFEIPVQLCKEVGEPAPSLGIYMSIYNLII